jgi:DNA-binding NarL/FixJ family response regulator
MKKIKVLIVDDMPQVRQDLRTFLNLTLDIEVVGEAANGIEAIHQTEIFKPDVILMDLEMPQLDGYQASRKIKTNDPQCKIIALSIHGGNTERQQALLCGIDYFVIKGEPLEDLIKTIHNLVLSKEFS